MTDLLCASANCRTFGQHATDCVNGDCKGCLPRLAADTLRLCEWNTAKIGTDAIEGGRLHGELVLVLSGTGRGGPRVSGGAIDKSINFNDLAGEVRATIRAHLVSWTKLIAEERGFTLPEDRVTDLAAFVARSARWLAANSLAASASDEMAELVQIARPVAYPSGTKRIQVGGCPECGSDLMAILRSETSKLPQEVVCAENVEHSWTKAQWLTLGQRLADAAGPQSPKVRLTAGTVGHGGWSSRRLAA